LYSRVWAEALVDQHEWSDFFPNLWQSWRPLSSVRLSQSTFDSSGNW
jgi:hypothetical protein